MNTLLIFVWIWAAMVANSFWESSVEGKNSWDKGKIGFKINFGRWVVMTKYHFFLFIVMWPLILTLPLIIYGFDIILFGILLSAFFSGLILEDFFWFVTNPTFKMKDWNSKTVKWYPWMKIGRFEIPIFYIVNIFLALTSWFFIWR